MFGQEAQDALNTRWQSMLTAGRVSDVLAEVAAQLDVDGLRDSAFLLCWQATAYNHLGSHAKALESAQRALQASANIDDPRTAALIHANIGMASQYGGSHEIDNALNSFEIAERTLRRLGDEWTLGAVFVNHAVYELSRGAIERGLVLLEKASSCSPVSEAERKEEPHRATIIRVNVRAERRISLRVQNPLRA
jgi:hypothetical protein